jgi:RNA polymerase sigma-70 factor (ECF subfamily)
MADLDDETGWIRKSQQGDPEAFEALIKRYQRMIHSLTFRMTGSVADSEDLAQETFIQAFQQLGSFREESKFSSWLYRVAFNTCLNWKKRTQRREQAHQQWGEQLEVEAPVAGGPGADVLTEAVQAALLELHPKQRAAVILTIYEGHNHAEAAKILGCSETTISWRLFAARRKLKKLLNPLISR